MYMTISQLQDKLYSSISYKDTLEILLLQASADQLFDLQARIAELNREIKKTEQEIEDQVQAEYQSNLRGISKTINKNPFLKAQYGNE